MFTMKTEEPGKPFDLNSKKANPTFLKIKNKNKTLIHIST